MLQNPEVRYLFNGKEYHLHFVGCSLYPQGYPAIVNQLGDFKGTNLLADIGNGTMNILYINNKKAQESRCWTEKLGVNPVSYTHLVGKELFSSKGKTNSWKYSTGICTGNHIQSQIFRRWRYGVS